MVSSWYFTVTPIMVCQLYFTMDFGIGCELVHPSVTMVQILRAVGLMAAIIATYSVIELLSYSGNFRALKKGKTSRMGIVLP